MLRIDPQIRPDPVKFNPVTNYCEFIVYRTCLETFHSIKQQPTRDTSPNFYLCYKYPKRILQSSVLFLSCQFRGLRLRSTIHPNLRPNHKISALFSSEGFPRWGVGGWDPWQRMPW